MPVVDPGPSGRTVFRLDGARVVLGDRLALDTGSLRLDRSSTVAVMGPNGSGKTTLLRLLAGLLEPTSGTVSPTGPDRPVVAYVAQHQHQHTWLPLTVAEVLRMGRYRRRGLLGRLTRDDRQLVADAAARLRVDDLLSRSFGELSGGQRQRVLMAGALANDADCLLLDEPITGLDLPSQELILDIVDAERDRGRLVVITTHHLEEARHCQRVLLLNTDVVADGSPDRVLTPDNLATAFGPRLLQQGPATDGAPVVVIDEHGHGHERDDHPVATSPRVAGGSEP